MIGEFVHEIVKKGQTPSIAPLLIHNTWGKVVDKWITTVEGAVV